MSHHTHTADHLESRVVNPSDPSWSSWYEKLDAFHGRAQFAHYRQHPAELGMPPRIEPGFFVVSSSNSGEIVAASLVRARRVGVTGLRRLFVDRGPCLLEGKLLLSHLHALGELLRERGHWIRVNPYICGDAIRDAKQTLELAGFSPTQGGAGEYSDTAVIDLKRSEDEIWMSLRQSARRNIRRARDAGLTVQTDTEGDLAGDFFRECRAAARAGSYRIPGAEGAADTFISRAKAGSGGVLLLSCYRGRQVAGIGLMPAGERLIYEWGYSVSDAQYAGLPLTHELHWEAIKWARSRGYRFYDMGGFWVSRGIDDPINRFKLSFSPKIEPVLAEHYYPLAALSGRILEAAIRLKAWSSGFTQNSSRPRVATRERRRLEPCAEPKGTTVI